MICEVEWPRWPVLTRTGKPSKSKKAGQRIPWLSMNVVNNMPRPVHRAARAHWRDAAFSGALHRYQGSYPVYITVQLFKASANAMDVGAILEGTKPLLDGLVGAGALAGDDVDHVRGILARRPITVGIKGATRVRLEVLAVNGE